MPNPTSEWWTNWGLEYTGSAFGTAYGGQSVQEACYRTLIKWMPAYTEEINRNLGGQVLLTPYSYRIEPDYTNLPRDLGVCQVVAYVDGTANTPERTNSGYVTTWKLQVQGFVAGTNDWQESQALTLAYGTCLRMILIQQSSMGTDFISATNWVGETYHMNSRASTRHLGLAVNDFEVTIENTVMPFAGPPGDLYAPTGAPTTDTPSLLPLPTPPTAETVNVTVENERV